MRIFPHRSLVVALIGVLVFSQVPAILAQHSTPPAIEASPEASPVMSQSYSETVAEQRATAVPFGDTETIGDLTITVSEVDADASELLNPDLSTALHDNQRVVTISLIVSNTGEVTHDLAAEHHFLIAGNRGVYNFLASGTCDIENSALDADTAQVEPGEERSFNACGIVSATDIESLQLWVSAPIGSVSSAERYFTGTWFDLGGDEPFDASVVEEQRAVATDLEPVGAEVDSPAEPFGAVAAGDLVYELISYAPDAKAGVTEIAQSSITAQPGETLVLATFRITNIGDRLLAPDIRLFDSTGLGANTRAVPPAIDNDAGGLLPGGAMERTWLWTVDDSERSSLAFRLSHSGGAPAVAWMLADESTDFSWTLDDMSLAPAASDSEEEPVPAGETASLPGLNILVESDSGNGGYALMLRMVSPDPNGSPYIVTLASDGDACTFTGDSGANDVFARFALPGAEFRSGIACGDTGGGVLEVTLADPESSDHVGYFDLEAIEQATPVALEPSATPAATPTAIPTTESVTPDATPETVPRVDDTATVIVAANVRSEPTLAGEIVTVTAVGETVTITGDGVEADGYLWVPIVTSNGTAGWIAEDFLER